MTVKKRNFQAGIRIKPDDVALEGNEGEIKVGDTSKKIEVHLDSSNREVLTNNQVQTIENKTIDVDNNTVSNIETDNLKAGVLVTDISLASSDTELPSALAVKTALEGQNEASEIEYDPALNPETSATNVQDALDDTGIASQAAQDAADAAQTTADNHIAAGTGAHAGTAISYDNSSSGLAANNVQTAIDEVEGRVDTIEGSYVQSFNTRTGAVLPAASDYDADQIDYDNSTSGLSAADVQAAIDEVDGTLDTHVGASSGVHGVTGNVVGDTDTQTLTNKTIQGADFQDPERSDVKKDTFANLVTYALTATNGQTCFATDTKQYFGVRDNLLVSLGGGVSDKSVYAQFDAEDSDVTGFTNISITSTDPINQDNSYSVDSYPASFPTLTLNDRNKGRENNLNIQYTMVSGTAKLLIKDNSSNTLSELEIDASSEVESVNIPYFVKDALTTVVLEVEDVSSATGLKLDDAVFSDDPFVYANLNQQNEFSASIDSSGTITSSNADFIASVNNSATGTYEITWSTDFFTEIPTVTGSVQGVDGRFFSTNPNTTLTGTTIKVKDDGGTSENRDFVIFVSRQGDDFKLAAETVVTPANTKIESYSANTTAGFASTNSAIPYYTTEAFNSVSSLGTVDNDSTNGWSFTANKDVVVNLSVNTATSAGGTNASHIGISLNSAQLTTAVTLITAADRKAVENIGNGNDATACVEIEMSEGDVLRPHGVPGVGITTRGGIEMVVTQRDANFLAAIPVDRVAYLKDVKTSGTNGGTFTSGSWQTRDLNTVEGDSSFITLSSNQFILPPGTYDYKSISPASKVDGHKARLQNITDATTEIVGQNSYVNSNNPQQLSFAIVEGRFTITSSKTFEVQHRCGTTQAGDGFGLALALDDEVYTMVEIRKIR